MQSLLGGAAEALPGVLNKEMDRMRLQKGLQDLSQEEGLTPFERFAKFSSIPGITPQMIQSGTNLLMQQDKAKSFKDMINQEGQQKPNPFAQFNQQQDSSSTYPTTEKTEDLENIQEGFVSPTKEQEYANAARKFAKNPGRFNNDPQRALDLEAEETLRNEKIAQDYQTRHKNLTDLQNRVVQNLNTHADKLGVQVPANVRSAIEDKAIMAIKPKSKGGGGMSEQEAKNTYGLELDQASREYSNLNSIGDWSMFRKTPSSINKSLDNLSDDFAKRNDSENMADNLIGENGLSPSRGYAIAYKVSRDKELNDELKKIPSINTMGKRASNVFKGTTTPEVMAQKTLEISEKLAPYLDEENNSPLSIGYELEKRGYDPQIWMQYLNEHKDDLRLHPRQRREISKPDSFTGTFNDWWLDAFTGVK